MSEPTPLLRHRRATGAALVLVLWFVAALSLIAVSLATSTRADTRAAMLQVSLVRAAAVGDAAINLALLSADADPTLFEQLVEARFDFDGHAVDVTLRPDSGLINLNAAPVALLRDLFNVAGDVDAARAEALARSLEEWRNPDEGGGPSGAYEAAEVPFLPRHGRFEATEDLLQVLGVDFGLYARIRVLVSAYGDASGVDVRFAPLEVLRVLAVGREDVARSIYDAFRAGEVGVDTSLLRQDHIEPGMGNYLRTEARVEIDGARFLRIRWVSRAAGGAMSVPWSTVSAETMVDAEPNFSELR